MAFQVMQYQISVVCISDIGLIRHNNEDFLNLLKDEQFFVLADGMGGHQAGEVASKTTVDSLCTLFQNCPNLSQMDVPSVQRALAGMIQETNALVYRLGRENPQLRGMGTTLCCVYLHPAALIYGHVGDSRIYRFRQGKLKQLTQDHSLLRELIELGQLSEQQAAEFLYKNIITKAVGTEPLVDPTFAATNVETDDILLMCTDGLSDLVSLEVMQEIICRNPLENIGQLLVEKAKKNGGYDNISLILIKIDNISS